MKKTIISYLLDIIFVTISFLSITLLNNSIKFVFEKYCWPYVFFLSIWLLASLVFKKHISNNSISRNFFRIIKINLVILMIFTMVIFFAELEYSRFLLLWLVFATTFFEIIGTYFYMLNIRIAKDSDDIDKFYEEYRNKIPVPDVQVGHEKIETNLKKLVVDEIGNDAFNYLDPYLNNNYSKTLFISTSSSFNIVNLQRELYDNIVNLKQINNIRRINKFFEAVNKRIPYGGIFIGFGETYVLRKKRILKKFPIGINWIVYTIDFLYRRVSPKILLTKKMYFFLTGGYRRVLSRAETFGRLYSCGFEVLDEKFIDGQQYFIARKINEPKYDIHPTYGPLIRLKRYGKGGKIIKVYKMRTMHAYSEYLQEYIYKRNNLAKGGKFKDDFRITTIGAFMRKFWIDELPMFINVFKGEMKIVGVRPLSTHFYNLYTDELKEKRIKYKPGLIPPYYVDMPDTLEEVMASELKYLNAYEKRGFITDWNYFWKALYNIFIKKARSA